MMSAPPGRATAPKGEWTVVGAVGSDLLLAKQSTIIRIPPGDVVLVAAYDMGLFRYGLEQAGKPKFDVVRAVSKAFDLSKEKALSLCKAHNLPLLVSSKKYEQKAIDKLKKALKLEDNDGKKET